MKVAVVFILLFATVLCRPARRIFDSSSESSEEVVRRPAARYMRKQAPVVPQTRAAVVQNVAAASGESKDSTDEVMEAAETPVLQFKSGSWDTTLAPDTATDDGQDSDDSDEDDDDTDENDTDDDEDDSKDTSESGESSTVAPTTVGPTVVTEVFVVETTEDYINPTIVTDDSARGDSLGGHPSDYKSIYVEDKSYHKIPAPYKSYEYYDTGKKSSYDTIDGNEVEKSLKVYKALQVHAELLEEDTSTPEVESQGLDGQDQDVSPRQASLPVEAESITTSENDSSSATQEEEEQEEDESTSAANDSASAESEDAESQSSEEATATPGAADSDSDESESEEEGAGPDSSTDMPVVITAK
ncbi:osteopontin [Solea solea]|uniref:osteopontin n=1 Tax=Solea solea TaxID=90069 RepID=UPI00272C30C6|nr:osteopontin [Solea solea]